MKNWITVHGNSLTSCTVNPWTRKQDPTNLDSQIRMLRRSASPPRSYSADKHRFQIFKKAGVKCCDLFLWMEWLERNFCYFLIILPLDFSEIFNIFRIRVILKKLKTIVISKLFEETSNNFPEKHSLWTSTIWYQAKVFHTLLVCDLEIWWRHILKWVEIWNTL